jgi:pilus assembly protein CpaE
MSSGPGSYLSSDHEAPAMHGEFMGFATDDESLAVLRGWAARQGYPVATVQSGGPGMFATMLESSAPPKMAAVDMDGQADPAAMTQRLVSLCGPDCKIIALGKANDVALYRRIVGAGAVDYLVKPLNAEVLNQAMASALKNDVGGKPVTREAKVVVVVGARGGVGASTVAINVAWLMAHVLNRHVALLDLDLQFGTSALALDLEPGRGLREIVSSPHRVDSLMIASSMVPESDQLSILGAEEAVDEFVTVDNAAIAALLKEMKGNFDVILVDLPRHLFATQKRLLASANDIVLVTELSLAGIRDTLRFRNALKSLECGGVVTLVGARMGAARAGQVDTAAFEKGAQVKIDILMPEDPKTVAEAANSGKAIGEIAKQAPVTKALHTLAVKLGGNDAKPSKKGGWMEKLTGAARKKPAGKRASP